MSEPFGKTDTARVIQVIETNLTRRGTGKDEESPMRIVRQYWSFDGELLAELDPCNPTTTNDTNP